MYSIELQTVFYEYQDKNNKIKIFHFDIRGKLSIIRCDKYILMTFQVFNKITRTNILSKLLSLDNFNDL